ncbi:MAG: adenylosuccinate synthase [Aquificae bacterium]|nr:adenylosuccinate synthase [Aquificota bacterium]
MSKKLVILGAQWGDEGKGKIVDLLSEKFDISVRYQGGSNAGHTVVIEGVKYIMHLLPTGILHPHNVGIIAQGMVVDLKALQEEIEDIEAKGNKILHKLYISDRAHVVMPYHKLLDKLFEKKNGVGTTLRGIGPAYMFKFMRKGIRMADLFDKKVFENRVKENIEFVKDIAEKVFGEKFEIDWKYIDEEVIKPFQMFKDRIIDTAKYLRENNKSVIFEGAQGTLLDIDMGTYPFVTSSNSSALGLANGTGLSPKYFSDAKIYGVAKAYLTRVGGGPFPTEIFGEEAEILREKGGEYGATTGRPRRVGWLDLVALKHSVDVNALDGIILTKLDVLDGYPEIKVCVGYEYNGKVYTDFPASLEVLENCKPIYKTLPGWKESTKGITDISKLPENARRYLEFIEKYIGVPIVMLSTGPQRHEYLFLKEIV